MLTRTRKRKATAILQTAAEAADELTRPRPPPRTKKRVGPASKDSIRDRPARKTKTKTKAKSPTKAKTTTPAASASAAARRGGPSGSSSSSSSTPKPTRGKGRKQIAAQSDLERSTEELRVKLDASRQETAGLKLQVSALQAALLAGKWREEALKKAVEEQKAAATAALALAQQ
jgi:hypothetical protein